MKKLICFFTIFVFWGITDSMAQGLHFGVKAGVLGNKANISGMRDQFKEESLTCFMSEDRQIRNCKNLESGQLGNLRNQTKSC